MDLQLIRNIITIGEEKSITKAADKLFISQPALNQQLLNLEKSLGTRLFIRKRGEWTITEAGHIYIDAGKRILDIQKDAYARIADVSEEKKEQIVYRPPKVRPKI
jgi:DNA-binding transcriptional LysR family regulator